MSTSVYRYYVLNYSEREDNGHGYRRGGSLGVIAKDILQAVQLGQQIKPGMTIWNVSHHGIVHGIAADAEFTLVVAE